MHGEKQKSTGMTPGPSGIDADQWYSHWDFCERLRVSRNNMDNLKKALEEATIAMSGEPDCPIKVGNAVICSGKFALEKLREI